MINSTGHINANYKYALIINAKTLKKVEIFIIIHLICEESLFDDLMIGHDDSVSDKQIR